MKAFRVLAVCLAVAAMPGASTVAAQEQVRDVAGATYVSGGVSEESRVRLQDQASKCNVQVIFALRSGEYLSGVEVTVADPSGKVILSTVTDGPWLFARLAPGSYEMRAALAGQAQAQKVTVPAQGSRQLVFRWEREG